MRPHNFNVFGIDLGYFEKITVTSVDTGTVDWRHQDTPHPREDRMLFGRDYLTPPVWTLNLATNPTNLADGLDALNQFEQAWRNNRRQRPGWYTPLTYERAGETRTVFGRPRKFARSFGKTYRHGVIHAQAEFQLIDALAYGDINASEKLTVTPGKAGGLIFPVIFPWGTRPGGPRTGIINIGGTTRTPVTVRIHGPITSPTVTGPGWKLSFPGLTLAYDHHITIDPRSQAVVRENGASVVASMERFYFDSLTLPPGRHEVTFAGVDPSGSGWAQVSWREAFIGY